MLPAFEPRTVYLVLMSYTARLPECRWSNDRLGLRLAKERASRSLKGGAIRLASQKPMLGSPTGQADRYGYLVRQLYFFQSGSRFGPQEAVMHKIVFAESKRCTG